MPYTTLISTDELHRHLEQPDWVILDCRFDLANPGGGRTAFEGGHIPRAQFADLDTDLSDKSLGPNGEFRGRHPLPAPEVFIEILRRWGISQKSQVVVYDVQGSMFAARLWWMLRWVGHAAVAVLDGGLQAWLAQGLPLSTETALRPRGDISLQPSLGPTVNAGDIVANMAHPLRVVIDARAPERYRGENETLDPVGGHIPGAKNRFFRENLQANGHFKPAEQLRAEFAAVISDPARAIMQCGSGVTACHHLLAMEIAGLPGAALYPGSWSEWCSDRSRPVATGDQP